MNKEIKELLTELAKGNEMLDELDAGFDVLVFLASKAEDEGMITCGNAVLSGRMPESEYAVL